MVTTVRQLISSLLKLDKNLRVFVGDTNVAVADPMYTGAFTMKYQREEWEGGNIVDTLKEGEEFVLIVGD